MNCKQFQKTIMEYIDGPVAGAIAERVEAHISTCAKCASLVRELKNTKSVVRSLDRLAAPDGFEALVKARLADQKAMPARQGLWTPVVSWIRKVGSAPVGVRPSGRRLALRPVLAFVVCLVIIGSVFSLMRNNYPSQSDMDWGYIETCREQHASFAAANPLADESAVMLRERARHLDKALP